MKVVLVLLVCVLGLVAGKIDPNVELPSSLKICRLNDPKRDECIKNSIQTFLPALRKKPENIDFPPVDPFTYESLTFSYKNSNILSGSFSLKDVKTYGMSKCTVNSVKSDFTDDEMTIQADIFFPKIFSTGDYKSNMTFSAFQLHSKGQYNVTMRDVTGKWNIKGKIEKIDGEDYMKVYKFDLEPEANEMKLSISGLFQDENLNKFANDFFNQYWKLLYKEMIPETKKQWEPILLNITNKLFGQIPFRRLLIKD